MPVEQGMLSALLCKGHDGEKERSEKGRGGCDENGGGGLGLGKAGSVAQSDLCPISFPGPDQLIWINADLCQLHRWCRSQLPCCPSWGLTWGKGTL